MILCILLAALAVLLDFLLQVTAFVALIVFDFQRTENKRVDCFPCIKTSKSSDSSDKGNYHILLIVDFCESKFSLELSRITFRSEKSWPFDSVHEGIS